MGRIFKVSASAVDEFLSCRKKYYFDRVLNIKPVERPDALDFGSAVHCGIASMMRGMYYKEKIDKDYVKEWAIRATSEYAEEYCMDDESTCKAVALVDAYVDRYLLEDFKKFEVLSVEQYIEAPINENPGGVLKCLHGYLDGVVKCRESGEIYVMEHKTTGMMSDGYIDKSHIDWQVIIYMLACKHKYGRCDGVIYDAISKPRHTLSVGETDEEFEARKAASKTGRIKRKEPETKEQFIARVKASFDDGTFRREFIDSKTANLGQQFNELDEISDDMLYCSCHYRCTGNCLKFGVCPYMDLCRGRATVDNLGEKYVNCDTVNE